MVGPDKTFYGDDRDRTGDPRLAKAVLSQLSYVPKTQRHPSVPKSGVRPTTAA